MKPESHRLGKAAEALAAQHLQKKGYRILGKNVRMVGGELDLIAQSNDIIVFVEVKARQSLSFGGAPYAITKSKKQRLMKLAAQYLSQHRLRDQVSRFDVVLCHGRLNQKLELTHIENAFEIPGEDFRW